MHNNKLKKIKLTIVAIVAATVLVMVSGIFLFKNNYYLNQKFVQMQWEYIKVKFEYASYSGELKKMLMGNFGEKTSASSQESAQSIPVLLYHGVMSDPNWKPDGVNISLSQFKDQMFTLKKDGYQTVTLKDFYSFMKEGKPLPAKSVLVTFDDGRSDSYFAADPIFRALDFNAIMFVITGRSLGENNEKSVFHLSQQELEKMKESGRWEFGSHTQNGHDVEKIDAIGSEGHFLSDKLWLGSQNRLETDEEYISRIKSDLAASKSDLENKLGISPLAFAYPFGDYGHNTPNNPDSETILRNAVDELFPLSFRQSGESEYPTNYPDKNYRLLKRINVNSDLSADQLKTILDESQKKTLPFSDNFSQNQGWITGWGKLSLENGLLLTGATESEDSSLTFLNGTFLWDNYSLSADAKLIKGNSFAVVGRYISGNNYASCDISENGVSLTERVRSEEKIISESVQPLVINNDANISVGFAANGDKASCLINGKAAVSGNLSPELSHGGIGFKTWDNTLNNSSLLISNLTVK